MLYHWLTRDASSQPTRLAIHEAAAAARGLRCRRRRCRRQHAPVCRSAARRKRAGRHAARLPCCRCILPRGGGQHAVACRSCRRLVGRKAHPRRPTRMQRWLSGTACPLPITKLPKGSQSAEGAEGAVACAAHTGASKLLPPETMAVGGAIISRLKGMRRPTPAAAASHSAPRDSAQRKRTAPAVQRSGRGSSPDGLCATGGAAASSAGRRCPRHTPA